MRFYLGSHHPGWLSRTAMPLFVSDVRLSKYRTLPRARGRWALDSGGFSMLSVHGTWSAGPSPRQYAERVRRYASEIGGLDWAAPQDWMCEPFITAKTGLSVAEHQSRTVANYLELRSLAADLPFAPVLQGFALDDYLRCAQLYERAGVDLVAADVVGVGSVCRRQATTEAAHIMAALSQQLPGVRLHGFGVKTSGLGQYGALLASADSMAWSYCARRSAPLPGCTGHKNCANCRVNRTTVPRGRLSLATPAVELATENARLRVAVPAKIAVVERSGPATRAINTRHSDGPSHEAARLEPTRHCGLPEGLQVDSGFGVTWSSRAVGAV